jgi:hypothetical protein
MFFSPISQRGTKLPSDPRDPAVDGGASPPGSSAAGARRWPATASRGLRRIAAVVALSLLATGCVQVGEFLKSTGEWLGSGDTQEVEEPVVVETAPPAVEPEPEPAPASPPPPRALTKNELRQVQKLLAELGYNPGPADGLIGPKTRDAIRNYRADQGYDEGAPVTTEVLARLKADIHGGEEASVAEWTPRRLLSDSPPVYQPGDIYFYSDGRVETVVRIDDDKVFWTTQDGSGFVSYSNFILPVISWKTDTRTGTRRLDIPSNSLWPLKVGNAITFSAEAVLAPQRGLGDRIEWTETWKCVIDGTETISVVSGEFGTFRIACRNSQSTSDRPQTVVWYYAPSVRHYVRQDELAPDGSLKSTVELVGIMLGGQTWPPVARAGLGWALDDVMESRDNGDGIVWQSSGVDSRVTIIPTSPTQSEGGTHCRTFVMVETREGWERSYPGKACRSPDGRWLIPGLV